MNQDLELRTRFSCPKCRSRECNVERATFVVGAALLPRPARFIMTTCALCGYTEFYEEAVLARVTEARPSETQIPELG